MAAARCPPRERWRTVETQAQDILPADRAATGNATPTRSSREQRRRSGVLHGPVMDYSRLPESMQPKHVFSALSFDAVNHVFRDGKVFSSSGYDASIGLFMGKTILAMEGKQHREHRNLVSAAFKTKSLARWEPDHRASGLQCADRRVRRRPARRIWCGEFTFEFPTRVIAQTAGPARGRPARCSGDGRSS